MNTIINNSEITVNILNIIGTSIAIGCGNWDASNIVMVPSRTPIPPGVKKLIYPITHETAKIPEIFKIEK